MWSMVPDIGETPFESQILGHTDLNLVVSALIKS